MAQVVWFKRDLRIADHQAFSEAARRGPTVPLYILEPDLSHRHYCFLNDSLAELNAQLIEHYGIPLVVRCGNASDILQTLHDEHSMEALWSNQETWNDWTYRRDRSVQRWARRQNTPWHQPRQFAVVRGRHNRDGWSRQWQALMDHDPEGQFIRQWISELTDYSAQSIHQPWVLPHRLNGYPLPIVDEKLARKKAMQRIYALRRSDGFFQSGTSHPQATRQSQNSTRPFESCKICQRSNRTRFQRLSTSIDTTL
jgi:deoxyribodipyrimidine photolyase